VWLAGSCSDQEKLMVPLMKFRLLMLRHFLKLISIPAIFMLIFLLVAPGTCAQATDLCTHSYDKKTEKSYNEGIDYFKRGNFTEASRIMKSIISQEPDFVDAYYVLGLSSFKKVNSNFKDAEKYFLKVI
jgi:Tfp pilus assembly protein PilF